MGIKLPTVNKFLFCLSLETGGTVLGWCSAIFSGILLVTMAWLMVLLIITFSSADTTVDNPVAFWIVASIIYAVYIIYFLILLYAAIQLVNGTKNRNHNQIKLYLILMGIGVILSFLQIITAGVAAIASAIVGAIITTYFFICIYSLYQMLKEGGTPY